MFADDPVDLAAIVLPPQPNAEECFAVLDDKKDVREPIQRHFEIQAIGLWQLTLDVFVPESKQRPGPSGLGNCVVGWLLLLWMWGSKRVG